MGCAAFIVRFILYALIIGIAYGIATAEWSRLALDQYGTGNVTSLASVPAEVTPYLWAVPVVAALLGAITPLIGTFAIWAAVGALITAPWAIVWAIGR